MLSVQHPNLSVVSELGLQSDSFCGVFYFSNQLRYLRPTQSGKNQPDSIADNLPDEEWGIVFEIADGDTTHVVGIYGDDWRRKRKASTIVDYIRWDIWGGLPLGQDHVGL